MSNNILEPVVNSLSEALKVGLKYLYKVMNIKPYFDIIDFFKEIELKNKKGQYPTLVKIYESQKGYTYLLGVPAGLSTDDFLKVKGALQIQLKNNIEIRERKGYIEVELITVELPSKIDYKVPARVKDSICIPFANSLNGAVYLDLKETPHTLVTGATGSGKSITTRNIITSILNLYPNEVNLYLIDFKIVELSIYKNLVQTQCYVNEVEEAKEVIADLMEECKRRYKLFEEVGVTNIYDYNKKVSSDKKLKFDFIVIEEFVMLLEDKKKHAMTNLKKLASLSRASGQFLYISAQRFDNTVIDLVLRSNVGNRLCHKVESENDSKLILDSPGANDLRGNGHMIFKCGSKKIECQSYFISDNQVNQYTKKYIVNRPYKPIGATEKDFKKDNDILISKENKELKMVKCETIKESEKIVDLSFIDNL